MCVYIYIYRYIYIDTYIYMFHIYYCIYAYIYTHIFLKTYTGVDSDKLKLLGLMSGHAYSILALHHTKNNIKLVQVRNPWGRFEWKGGVC